MRHISRSSLMAQVPEPTAQDLAELAAYHAKRDAERQQRAAAEAAFDARMRGRSIFVGGHDGKVMYVTITRPGAKRMWRIPLPERATPRTLRFLRVAQSLGADINHIVGWAV